MTNAPFITIHGIDGTGKTSAAENTAHMLRESGMKSIYYDDIVSKLAYERSTGDPTIDKKLAQSALINSYLTNNTSVTRDRWFIDVCADRGFKGQTAHVADGILVPDYSVVLTCRDDVRLGRIYARGNPTEQDLIENKEGTRAHFFEQYLLRNIGAFAHRSLIIDTTNLTQDMVTDRILHGVL